MDPNQRRQQVARALSNLDEGGNHVISANQAEQPQNSFTYIPEVKSVPVDDSSEFHIPHGTPQLFEIEGLPLEDGAQPSPLSPQEVQHAVIPAAAEPASLEKKFVDAINSPELPDQDHSNEIHTATEMDNLSVHTETLANGGAIEASRTAGGQGEEIAQSAPHSEHFPDDTPEEITLNTSDDDAGLGATLMEKRQKLKQEQEVG